MNEQELRGQRIIAAIVEGKLIRMECGIDKEHPCIGIWAENADEQLGAMVVLASDYAALEEALVVLAKRIVTDWESDNMFAVAQGENAIDLEMTGDAIADAALSALRERTSNGT